MHRIVVLVCLLCAAAQAGPPRLEAQAQRLEENSRVQIRESRRSPAETYTVVRMAGDTLVLHNEATGERRMAFQDASEIRVLAGRRSDAARARRGALVGAGIGAGMGVAIGLLDGDDPPGFVSFSAGEKAMLGGLVLGGAGALLGAVVGLATPGEVWERVEIAFAPPSDRRPGWALSLGYSAPR